MALPELLEELEELDELDDEDELDEEEDELLAAPDAALELEEELDELEEPAPLLAPPQALRPNITHTGIATLSDLLIIIGHSPDLNSKSAKRPNINRNGQKDLDLMRAMA